MLNNSMAEKEFNFWKTNESIYEEKFNDHNEQGFGATSSPLLLWKDTRSSKNLKRESFPFLPPHHQFYIDLSLRSRRQIIIDGRKELMDSIRNMPESCYELSLKDIVEKQHSTIEENDQEDNSTQDDCLKFEVGTQIRKQKKGSMKKTKARKFSRYFWRSSSQRSDDYVDKDCWIKRILFARKCVNITTSNTNGSTSSCSSISSTSRWADNYVPGCWFFLPSKKSKNNKQSGCIC